MEASNQSTRLPSKLVTFLRPDFPMCNTDVQSREIPYLGFPCISVANEYNLSTDSIVSCPLHKVVEVQLKLLRVNASSISPHWVN